MENLNFSTDKKPKNKLILLLKKYVNVIFILISLTVLSYFCICNNNLVNLISTIPYLNTFWVIAAFCLIVLYWILESIVIKRIVNIVDSKKYPKLFFLKITMIGQYFNSITPLGIAGQPMQILELCKQSLSKSDAITITTRKFFVYQSSLAAYSLICTILYYNTLKNTYPELIWMVWVGTLFQSSLIILILIFSVNKNIILKLSNFIINILYKTKIIKNKENTINSIETTLDSFVKTNKNLNKNKKINAQIYTLTFLQITVLFLIPLFVFKAFNHSSMPILPMICIQSTINTISSFTPFPGAAGTSENSFVILFSLFFTIQEIGKAMLLSRFISCYFTIIIGMVCNKILFKK